MWLVQYPFVCLSILFALQRSQQIKQCKIKKGRMTWLPKTCGLQKSCIPATSNKRELVHTKQQPLPHASRNSMLAQALALSGFILLSRSQLLPQSLGCPKQNLSDVKAWKKTAKEAKLVSSLQRCTSWHASTCPMDKSTHLCFPQADQGKNNLLLCSRASE